MHKLLLTVLGQAVSNSAQEPHGWNRGARNRRNGSMDGTGKRRPATAEDFHRLGDVAHQRGLRLFRDGPRWYCSSASTAGGCHYVTGLSCDCPGFIAHQRCTHHALLLERLGWLPEVEVPVSP